MELKIDKNEVARYLGFKTVLDPETLSDIERVSRLVIESAVPRWHYKVATIEKGDSIKVVGANLTFCGNSIKELLADCDRCVLVVATLGSGVDNLLRKLQISNLADALVADCSASSLCEDLINQVEEEVKKATLKQGEFFTDRFSPGYGDLPLEIQKSFCEVLDSARKVGVSVASGGIMIPRKSVTAILGIANRPQQMKIKGCKYCDLKDTCMYRKEGTSCAK